MKVISVKRFESGFCLTEAELRRLIENCKDQFRKNPAQGEIFENYTVTFKNGTIADDLKFNDILDQENHGHGKIISLKIVVYKNESVLEKPEDSLNRIIISFSDSGEPLFLDHYSVFLSIIGETRDWVFLTTSVLLDRIEKIKRKTYMLQHLQNQSTFFIIIFLAGLLCLGLKRTVVEPITDLGNLPSYNKLYDSIYVKKLDSFFIKQNSSNAIEFLTGLEKLKIETSNLVDKEYEKLNKKKSDSQSLANNKSKFEQLPKNIQDLLVFILPAFLMFLILRSLMHYYPLYNFVWGDYSEIYNKKMNGFKYLIYTIIGGTLLSIIANKLTDLL